MVAFGKSFQRVRVSGVSALEGVSDNALIPKVAFQHLLFRRHPNAIFHAHVGLGGTFVCADCRLFCGSLCRELPIILMYSNAPLPPTFPRIYSLSPITRTFPRICTTSTHTATGKSTDTSTPVPTGILDIRKRTTGPTTPTELTGILHSSPVMGTRIRITDSGIRIRLIPDAEPALRSNLLKASLFSDRSYETKKSLPMSDRQGIAAAANLGSQPQGKPEHAARLLIRCLLDHLSWGDVLSQGRVPAASMGDRLIGRIPGPVVARRCRFDSCESIRVLSGTNPEK